MEIVNTLISKFGLITAFVVVGVMTWFGYWVSKRLTNNRIPGAAIAITLGLVLAYFGDEKGLASFPLFSGLAILGGAMFRDFTIVATAAGASLKEIKSAGFVGVLSLFIGIVVAFLFGVCFGYAFGYRDVIELTTLGAGACTYIVGPVTGDALGASSDVIAISVATGVVKTIFTTFATPLVARRIGLVDSKSAMIFGGLLGTTSGVAAGLAATDEKLVPYGALTATFYTGLGVLLVPTVGWWVVQLMFG